MTVTSGTVSINIPEKEKELRQAFKNIGPFGGLIKEKFDLISRFAEIHLNQLEELLTATEQIQQILVEQKELLKGVGRLDIYDVAVYRRAVSRIAALKRGKDLTKTILTTIRKKESHKNKDIEKFYKELEAVHEMLQNADLRDEELIGLLQRTADNVAHLGYFVHVYLEIICEQNDAVRNIAAAISQAVTEYDNAREEQRPINLSESQEIYKNAKAVLLHRLEKESKGLKIWQEEEHRYEVFVKKVNDIGEAVKRKHDRISEDVAKIVQEFEELIQKREVDPEIIKKDIAALVAAEIIDEKIQGSLLEKLSQSEVETSVSRLREKLGGPIKPNTIGRNAEELEAIWSNRLGRFKKK